MSCVFKQLSVCVYSSVCAFVCVCVCVHHCMDVIMGNVIHKKQCTLYVL